MPPPTGIARPVGCSIARSTGVNRLFDLVLRDAVIVNADYGHAFTTLLNGSNIPEARMRAKKFSCSTFMLYLGLDKIYRDEPHHHVVHATAHVAGRGAVGHADHQAHERGDHADGQGHLGAIEQAREEVAAEAVGPEPVLGARRRET